MHKLTTFHIKIINNLQGTCSMFELKKLREITVPRQCPRKALTNARVSSKVLLIEDKCSYNKLKATGSLVLCNLTSRSYLFSPWRWGHGVKAPATSHIVPKYLGKDLIWRISLQIRAKEVQKQMNEMTRSPAEGKRRVMIGRLPEIVRIIRTYPLLNKMMVFREIF